MHQEKAPEHAPIAATVRQRIEIPYSYVTGPAMTHFLSGLKECIIYAGVCSGCGRRNVPPVSFCGRCWTPVTRFEPVGPRGILESYTEIPGAPAGSPDGSSPVIFGLIRLESADTSLVHWIDCGSEFLCCGAAVEPVWRDDRQGSILDLTAFRLRKNTSPHI